MAWGQNELCRCSSSAHHCGRSSAGSRWTSDIHSDKLLQKNAFGKDLKSHFSRLNATPLHKGHLYPSSSLLTIVWSTWLFWDMGMDPLGNSSLPMEPVKQKTQCNLLSMEAAGRTSPAWFLRTVPTSHPPPAAVFPPHKIPPPAAQEPLFPPWIWQHDQHKLQFFPGQTSFTPDRSGSTYQSSFAGGHWGEDGQTARKNNHCCQHSCSLRTSPQPLQIPSGLGHRSFLQDDTLSF